jgi:hypothetical protein
MLPYRSFFIASLLLFFCGWTVFSCRVKETYPGETADREVAEKHCQSCHQLPTPDLVDKTIWTSYVFPKMGPLLGINSFEGKQYKQEKGLLNSYLFPEQPMLSEQEWKAIIRYYTTLAPAAMPPQGKREAIRPTLPLFKVHTPSFDYPTPTLSLVKIDTSTQRIYFGDAERGTLSYTDSHLKQAVSRQVGVGPVQLDRQATGFRLLTMGNFHPSDFTTGQVQDFASDTTQPKNILDGLGRPTSVAYHDLNGDGKEDIVVCGFGYYTGKLNWYEKTDRISFMNQTGYTEHVLNANAGAIQVAIRDFNNDRKPDLLVLMAQADEGFDLYLNAGEGKFMEPQRLLRFSPSFGSNSFQLVDFDKDGHVDIIATNGDNGDYRQIRKNYHGVRIYLNDGRNHFSEKYFYPINGITKAIAADFDADGDLDMATVAYFPDYERSPEESFVYLENRGDFRFEAFTFPEVGTGRWQVMDAGDADRDGDLDLVLGSCVVNQYPAPEALRQQWKKLNYPVVLLENTGKTAR